MPIPSTGTDQRTRLEERIEAALARRHTRNAERMAEQLMRTHPGDPRAMCLMARVMAARGRVQAALRMLRTAGADENPEVARELARILAGAGRHEEARKVYLDGLRRRPQDTQSWLELAELLRQQGDPGAAIEAYANAIRCDPTRVEGYLALGELLQHRRAFTRAIQVYREGLKVMPRSPDLLCDLGAALLASGQVDQAANLLNRSLTLKPVNTAALYNLAMALLQRGDLDAAALRFQQLLKLRPRMARAWLGWQQCGPREDSAAAIGKLEALLSGNELSEDSRATAAFALGHGYHHAGDFAAAADAYRQANRLRAHQHGFDPAAARRLTDALIESFAEHGPGALAQERGQALVFVTGAPGSGVHLLAQILAGHSQVASSHGADALAAARAALFGGAEAGGYPEAAPTLGEGALETAARRYLDDLPAQAPRVCCARTDLINQVGLLKWLFPGARVLLVEREERDTAVSMYRRDLSRGHGYAFDLAHIESHLADARRLREHWLTLWPETVMVVRFEALIGALEATMDRVMGFLGLQAEPHQRDFPQRRNAVPPDSAWALRQRPDPRAVGRWRAYAPYLDLPADES